jgi:hypothetical protein
MDQENSLNAELERICAAASQEQDSQRLVEYVQKIIQLIDAKKVRDEEAQSDSGFILA